MQAKVYDPISGWQHEYTRMKVRLRIRRRVCCHTCHVFHPANGGHLLRRLANEWQTALHLTVCGPLPGA